MKNCELKKNIAILSNEINFLRRNYSVKAIDVFGSVARSEQKKYSDLDVIVEFSEPVGFFKFIELEYFLSRVLKRKVDLVTKNALKPAIKQNVLKQTVYA
jgi:predicted nucleotidyltransferase